MIVVLDVWGGENSMTHIARFIFPPEIAVKHAMIELNLGYLVNLWAEVAWDLNNALIADLLMGQINEKGSRN